jgi:hypothetical protein
MTPSSPRLTGYRSEGYAASLAEFGRPRLLRHSGGWILQRAIGAGPAIDAMGCYPLFCCADWSGLNADLDELAPELVSLVLVTDPFGDFNTEDLRRCFPDRFAPFKTHFVADLRRRPGQFVSAHHRYYARRARRLVDIERCDEPARFLDEWTRLYANLISRRGVVGIQAFSRRAFEKQLNVPGSVMLRAIRDGEAVAAHFWYRQGNAAYSHLAASAAAGYELMASYALYWFALETFAPETHWLDFGGSAGIDANASDGLTQFKRGWATETRPAFLCGRIFDRQVYDRLAAARRVVPDGYFPLYRRGERG